MNKITKKSFYSFLTLYLISSFFFLSVSSYWFYTAQISTEMNANFHKMNNISNKVLSDVIFAEMMETEFVLPSFTGTSIALLDANRTLRYGKLAHEVDFTQSYYKKGMTFSFISQNLNKHLGLKYIVIQSNECAMNAQKIRENILYTALCVALIIIFISVILSYIFLKPIKDKMHEVEEFIKDTTHELNTPISALMMSTSRVKEKQTYDAKVITNISISTKQLYDIYASLTYLSFDNSKEKALDLDFADVVHTSLQYFNELLHKKNLSLICDIQACPLHIAPIKAKMLINNLLSNAIKYSPPNKKIYIQVSSSHFSIKDEGIGIKKEKLGTIFKRFSRASSYAGGFGVGLSIINGIAKEYKYTIDVRSQERKGTEVIIEF